MNASTCPNSMSAPASALADAIYLNNTGVQFLMAAPAGATLELPKQAMACFKKALTIIDRAAANREGAKYFCVANTTPSSFSTDYDACLAFAPLALQESNGLKSFYSYGSAVLLSPDLVARETPSSEDLVFCTAVMMTNTALVYHNTMNSTTSFHDAATTRRWLQKASSIYQLVVRTLQPLISFSSCAAMFLACAALNNDLAITLQLQGPHCPQAQGLKKQLETLYQQLTSRQPQARRDFPQLDDICLNLVFLNSTNMYTSLPAPGA